MPALNYIPAKIHQTKRDFYVDWYIYAPEYPTPRQRVRLNRIAEAKRMPFAEKLCAEIDHYLSKGENPWECIPFLNKRKQKFSSLAGPVIVKTEIKKGFEMYFTLIQKQNARHDTLRSYKSIFKLFVDWMPVHSDARYIHEINKQTVQRFLDHLLFTKNYSNRSHENVLSTLKTVWRKFFIPRDAALINPFEDISNIKQKGAAKNKKRVFTINELKTIKKTIAEDNPFFWCVCGADYYCYVRRTEITRLKMRHFNFDNKCILIDEADAKDWTFRVVKLPDEFFTFLIANNYHKYNGDLFFTSADNFRPGAKQLNPTRITEQMRRYLDALNIDKKLSFYDLKRSGLYYFRERGGDKEAAKFQAGHSSDEMHYTYYKPSLRMLTGFESMSIDNL